MTEHNTQVYSEVAVNSFPSKFKSVQFFTAKKKEKNGKQINNSKKYKKQESTQLISISASHRDNMNNMNYVTQCYNTIE